MLEILLIRHGQTDWNRDRRIMGRKAVPLNRAGLGEARRLTKALRGVEIDMIYTSPVHRAVQTARCLLDGRRVRVVKAPEVAEIDYGHWIGKTFEEVIPEKAFRVYHKTPRKAQAPGGEHMRDVFGRTIPFIEGLRRKHKKGRIAVVSHADVIKTILVHYLGMDYDHLLKLRIDNTSISLLWFYGERVRVMAVNVHPTPRKLFGLTDLLTPNLRTAQKRKSSKRTK